MAAPAGYDPAISAVTAPYSNQLNYGVILYGYFTSPYRRFPIRTEETLSSPQKPYHFRVLMAMAPTSGNDPEFSP